MASNWRQVLAVDAVLGVVGLVSGIIVAALASASAGGVLGAMGGAYLGIGLCRWRRWGRLRAEAGLDGPDDGPPDQ